MVSLQDRIIVGKLAMGLAFYNPTKLLTVPAFEVIGISRRWSDLESNSLNLYSYRTYVAV